MASVSTLVHSAKHYAVVANILGMLCVWMVSGCQSPLDLDVDRDTRFPGPPVHPKQLSILYYHDVADAYELVVTDTAVLNHIDIALETTPCKLSFQQIIYTLPDSIPFNPKSIPFVRSFSIAANNLVCDGSENDAVGANTWITYQTLSNSDTSIKTQPTTTGTGNRIKQTFFTVPNQNVVRGTLLISIADPATPLKVMVYRALVTIEY